ncbi:hypothetical protein ACO0LL_13600 [Undibacterium sp. TC4M20W]|uniref:hypothetical protein n=1 Tax=Undibacterium sp. TC4M20W TaxID=3413052 RepID=UPI003BF21E58
MKLFNFDHGFSQPITLKIGPFNIQISEIHCDNLKRLPKRAIRKLTHDDQWNRKMETVPRARGEFVETAVLLDVPDSHSLLFPNPIGPTLIYDLKIFLSFLTGRRVYTEDELEWDPRREYADPLMLPEEIFGQANMAWKKIAEFSEKGFSDAIFCIVQASYMTDVIGKGAYLNAAFETFCTSWAKENRKTTFQDRKLQETAMQKVVSKIDNSMLNKARNLMVKFFRIEGVSNDVTDDILARFKSSGAPSAILKMTWFLQELEMFPKKPTAEQEKRLRRLNTIRNSIAHSGTIRPENGLSQEVNLRISGASVLLIMDIVSFYLANNIFGFRSRMLNDTHNDIKIFFENGIFRNQEIISEDFGAYLDRVETQWVEEGKAIW